MEVVHHAVLHLPALLLAEAFWLSALGPLPSPGDRGGGGGGKGRPPSSRRPVRSTLWRGNSQTITGAKLYLRVPRTRLDSLFLCLSLRLLNMTNNITLWSDRDSNLILCSVLVTAASWLILSASLRTRVRVFWLTPSTELSASPETSLGPDSTASTDNRAG